MNYARMNHYQKVEVETNDPIKLIIMLFEGAVKFIQKAKLRMEENNMADKGILISKALAIVSELQGSLNLEKGGEVAGNMDRIYTYIRDRLVEANQKNDAALLKEVIGHLRILKSAWEQAQLKIMKEVSGATATNVQTIQMRQAAPQPQLASQAPLNNTEPGSRPAIEIVG